MDGRERALVVQEAAKAKGLDRAELAQRTGVAHGTITRVWNGKADNITTATVTALARVLGIQKGDLV